MDEDAILRKRAARKKLQDDFDRDMENIASGEYMQTILRAKRAKNFDIERLARKVNRRAKLEEDYSELTGNKFDYATGTWYKEAEGKNISQDPVQEPVEPSVESEKLDFQEQSGYKDDVREEIPQPTTNDEGVIMATNEQNTSNAQQAAPQEPGFMKRLWADVWSNKGKIAGGMAVGVAVGVGGKVVVDRRAAKKAAAAEAAAAAAASTME
jgi:hypothetical protein